MVRIIERFVKSKNSNLIIIISNNIADFLRKIFEPLKFKVTLRLATGCYRSGEYHFINIMAKIFYIVLANIYNNITKYHFGEKNFCWIIGFY